jgi:hypothetical protein
MKRTAKKPRVTVKAGEAVDNASVGGPYVTRFVSASVGRLKEGGKNRKGEWQKPTGHGVRVYLEEWMENDPSQVYLSIDVQRGVAHERTLLEGPMRTKDLDSVIELLTLAREAARETFWLGMNSARQRRQG